MTTKFKGLKWKLLKEVFLNVLFAVMCWFIVAVLVLIVFRNPIVSFIEWFGMKVLSLSRQEMQLWYVFTFRDNRDLIFSAILVVIVIFFLYRAFSKVVEYLNQVYVAMDIVVARDDADVVLDAELAPLQQKLNAAKQIILSREEAAREAEQRKDDLVVYLAHDLKTPLTSVIGYLNLLQDINSNSPQLSEKYTEIALRKANSLEELINEFFEIARYNAQSMQLQRTQFDLSMMLRQIADEMYPLFSEKKLDIELEFDDRIIVCADNEKLARVFGNLLKNAASYSFGGSKIIVRADTAAENAIVSIENSGNTIAQKDLNNIFQKFYRLDAARTSETGSAGLGLAISKEIVLLHGGEITATSNDGKTVFTVTIPIS